MAQTGGVSENTPGPAAPGRAARPGRPRPEHAAEADDRRRRIWALAVARKLSSAEIAEVVGVCKRTVERDLAVVRRRVRDHLRREGRLEEAIFEAATQVQATSTEVTRHAWQEFLQAPKGSLARARFLRIVLTSQDDLVRILQSLGIIKRVPDEVLVGGLEIERRLSQLTDQQAQEALDFLDGILGASEPHDGEGAEQP